MGTRFLSLIYFCTLFLNFAFQSGSAYALNRLDLSNCAPWVASAGEATEALDLGDRSQAFARYYLENEGLAFCRRFGRFEFNGGYPFNYARYLSTRHETAHDRLLDRVARKISKEGEKILGLDDTSAAQLLLPLLNRRDRPPLVDLISVAYQKGPALMFRDIKAMGFDEGAAAPTPTRLDEIIGRVVRQLSSSIQLALSVQGSPVKGAEVDFPRVIKPLFTGNFRVGRNISSTQDRYEVVEQMGGRERLVLIRAGRKMVPLTIRFF